MRIIQRSGASVMLLVAGIAGISGYGQQNHLPSTTPATSPAENPSSTDPARNPADPTVKPANVPTAPASPISPGVGVDIHKYVIGAEDVLFIQVWREPDFTRPVVVRPDGKITMPLIGEVQATGLTPEQLGTSLRESLSKLINNPDVNVSVTAVNSKRYFLDGEVIHPGEYKLVTPTTILEALSLAGGFREFANAKKIFINRNGKLIRFNYKDVIRGKHLEQNVYLETGDHIIVP